jgi:hypothetical protein
MVLPKVVYCIICEEVRPERNNLSSILGFYGVTPHVDVLIKDLSKPLPRMNFLVSLAGGESGKYEMGFHIVDPNGEIVVDAPGTTISFDKPKRRRSRYNLAMGIAMLKLPRVGTYTFKLFVNGMEHYGTTFEVLQGQPDEFAVD